MSSQWTGLPLSMISFKINSYHLGVDVLVSFIYLLWVFSLKWARQEPPDMGLPV